MNNNYTKHKCQSSKAFKKWSTLLDKKAEGQPWSENEIIYFRKALGQSGLKSQDEKEFLLDKFEDVANDMIDNYGGFNITEEQQQKGIDYLLKNTYKKNGDLRKNNIFNYDEIEILNGYSHFKFVGLYPQTNMLGNTLGYLPVYRLYDRDGNFFEYTGTVYSMIKIIYTCDMHNKPNLRVV